MWGWKAKTQFLCTHLWMGLNFLQKRRISLVLLFFFGGGEGGQVVINMNLKFTFSFHKQKINLWGIAIIRKNKENIIERQNFNGEKFELWEFHNFHLKLLKKIRLLYTRTTTNISLNFTIRTSWTWHGLKTIHLPFLRESLRCTVCSSPNLTYLL